MSFNSCNIMLPIVIKSLGKIILFCLQVCSDLNFYKRRLNTFVISRFTIGSQLWGYRISEVTTMNSVLVQEVADSRKRIFILKEIHLSVKYSKISYCYKHYSLTTKESINWHFMLINSREIKLSLNLKRLLLIRIFSCSFQVLNS